MRSTYMSPTNISILITLMLLPIGYYMMLTNSPDTLSLKIERPLPREAVMTLEDVPVLTDVQINQVGVFNDRQMQGEAPPPVSQDDLMALAALAMLPLVFYLGVTFVPALQDEPTSPATEPKKDTNKDTEKKSDSKPKSKTPTKSSAKSSAKKTTKKSTAKSTSTKKKTTKTASKKKTTAKKKSPSQPSKKSSKSTKKPKD